MMEYGYGMEMEVYSGKRMYRMYTYTILPNMENMNMYIWLLIIMCIYVYIYKSIISYPLQTWVSEIYLSTTSPRLC